MTPRIPILFCALLFPLVAQGDETFLERAYGRLHPPKVIPLWANGAPGFEDRKDIPEVSRDYWVRNVNNPTLTVFAPPEGKANGCGVVIIPGGGFKELVFMPEGRQPADYLTSLGITVFVLKYRLPKADNSPYTMDNVRQDVHRAMRMARSRAGEFHVDPHRMGILGFSAGGVMVMMVAFEKGDGDPNAPDPVDRLNSRPDFEMLVYPGKDIVPNSIPSYAPEALLVVADNDEYEGAATTIKLLQMFREAGVSVEAHVFAAGKHAFNMGDHTTFLAVRHWPHLMADWLEDRGLLKPPAGTP